MDNIVPKLAISIEMRDFINNSDILNNFLEGFFDWNPETIHLPYLEKKSNSKNSPEDYAWFGARGDCRILVINGDFVNKLSNGMPEECDVVISLSGKSNPEVVQSLSTIGVPTIYLEADNFTGAVAQKVFNRDSCQKYMSFRSDNDRSPAYDIGVGTIIGLINILLQMLIK